MAKKMASQWGVQQAATMESVMAHWTVESVAVLWVEGMAEIWVLASRAALTDQKLVASLVERKGFY